MWFAVRGANGVPFGSVEAATPTTANSAGAHVLADRQELSSLPREAKTQASANGVAAGHDRGGKKDSGTRGGGKQDPLLQATIPGVGSVTVEKPTVPDTGVAIPDLPDSEIAVPGTVTVTLP